MIEVMFLCLCVICFVSGAVLLGTLIKVLRSGK